jgi:MarR family 2-MHQ and catechol resistance regulon transcriptional repressor
MPSQVLTKQSSCVEAFVALLRAHAATTRRLSAQLTADHGLTINDFEVLLRLARAPDRRMRRVDLAEQVVLTPSGVTRLLEGLERGGLVERSSCDTDRRVVYAVLTDAGLARITGAAASHFAQVDDMFGARFDEAELDELVSLLSKLGDADVELPCEPASA